jgi:hypothetical protein
MGKQFKPVKARYNLTQLKPVNKCCVRQNAIKCFWVSEKYFIFELHKGVLETDLAPTHPPNSAR